MPIVRIKNFTNFVHWSTIKSLGSNTSLIIINLMFVTIISTAKSSQCQTIYVSPTAKVHSKGYPNIPTVADIETAITRIRASRQRNAASQQARIVLLPGYHYLNRTINLSELDSNLIIESIEAERLKNPTALEVTISGGKPVNFDIDKASGEWVSKSPPSSKSLEQLFVNGTRCQSCRLPKTGWFKAEAKYDNAAGPAIPNFAGRALCIQKEVFDQLTKYSQEDLKHIVVVIYHSWEISRHHIERLEPKQHALILKGPGTPWELMAWGPNQRFHLENVPGPLSPGEFHITKNSEIRYLPLPGQNPKTAKAITPQLDQFVIASGNMGKKLRNVTIRGVKFECAGYTLPDDGHSDDQAAKSIQGVIQVDHAQNFVMENCEINNAGLYGIWIRKGCQNCVIRQNWFQDLGAGGVRIGDMESASDPEKQTFGNTVDNNIIHKTGQIFMGSVSVWTGQSGNNKITHNDISDSFYTGISDGWTWGYDRTLTQNNHIDLNHIHHIGQGVLSDMGAIYTLGDHTGSTANGNVIHDVYSYDKYGRGGWGLYTDEGTTNIVMRGNLVYNVKTGGFHQHYGKDNLITNNIFVNSLDGQIQRSRAESHNSFTFEHNIVAWTIGKLFTGQWQDNNVKLENNIYWNFSKHDPEFEGASFSIWKGRGKDKGSVIADPLFMNAFSNDFRLKPNSPAFNLGFLQITPSNAGTYGSKAWKELPRSFRYHSVTFRD